MVNTELLKNKIDASGLKPSFIIEKLGYSRTAYYMKINNQRPFRNSDVYVLCDILNIKDEKEKNSIFFA